MASFVIILVVCGALCSIARIESSPFPPLTPTRRYGPPESVNLKPGSLDWEPGTPPQKPPKRPPVNPGPGTAQEAAGPDSYLTAEELAGPDSDPGTPPKKPGPGTAEEPAVPDLGPDASPTRRYGPPEFFNGNTSSKVLPTRPLSRDSDPGTPPQKPPKRPPMKPGLVTAEEPAVPDSNPIPVPALGPDAAEELAVPDSNPIPVPGTTFAEEFPNSVATPPKKPGLQDLHLIPVPITGGGPAAYP